MRVAAHEVVEVFDFFQVKRGVHTAEGDEKFVLGNSFAALGSKATHSLLNSLNTATALG